MIPTKSSKLKIYTYTGLQKTRLLKLTFCGTQDEGTTKIYV